MRRTRFLSAVLLAAVAAGCGSGDKKPAGPPISAPRRNVETYVPYVPATQPTPVAVAPEELPKSPRDPQPGLSLYYAIEVWELLLPRDTISSDEAFWKRVNEQVVDLATHDQLDKNGMRVGALPTSDANFLSDLVEQRKGKKTSFTGLSGRQIELMMKENVDRQTLFFLDHDNYPVGRSYDRSSNLFLLSFEPAPRQPNAIRLALTPGVRTQNKRPVFSIIPGKPDRERGVTDNESRYDANLVLDLPLSSMLVLAPSPDARFATTLGHAFLINETPSQQQERVIVVIPRAFQKADEANAGK